MAAYAYFPGCSLSGIGKPYDESVRAVFAHLGLALEEVPDWNCCGATSYMSIDASKAVALASRNLAIAEAMGHDVVAPCAACYLVLTKAQHVLTESPAIAEKVDRGLRAAGLEYRGQVRVRHPLDVLVNDVGLEALRARVTHPLDDYRAAPYYGCQVVRPYGLFDDPYAPTSLERLLRAVGAAPVEYPLKTRCCGGALMGTAEEIGLSLNHLLLREARERGANVLATLCPLCQFNLEAYQGRIARTFGEDVTLPIAYFTQLVGLALGLSPVSLGLQRNFVVAAPLPVPA
jgi:heterodisulfide reductase subunit B